MRTYKFRMWDTEEKCFMNHSMVIESRLLDLEKNGECRFVFQQWTGLLDKQGKEIYEGDILSDDNYSNVDGAVVFNEEKGYYEIDKFNYEPLHESLKDYDFEVLGNIYENSELLEN